MPEAAQSPCQAGASRSEDEREPVEYAVLSKPHEPEMALRAFRLLLLWAHPRKAFTGILRGLSRPPEEPADKRPFSRE